MKRVALSLLFLAALCGPANAAFTVTQKTATVNASNASLTTSSQTYTAGTIILVTGFVRLASSSDTFTVTGSVSGAMTVYRCAQSAGGVTPTGGNSYIAYVVAAGGAETVNLTASATATALFINTAQVSGGPASSPEDATVRACNGSTGATTSPSTTSGVGSQNGDLIVSSYGAPNNSAGFTYTNDAGNGWTQLGGTGGSTNLVTAIAYQTNAGSAAITASPTTTAATYALATVGFKDASPPANTVSGGLSLRGVGN